MQYIPTVCWKDVQYGPWGIYEFIETATFCGEKGPFCLKDYGFRNREKGWTFWLKKRKYFLKSTSVKLTVILKIMIIWNWFKKKKQSLLSWRCKLQNFAIGFWATIWRKVFWIPLFVCGMKINWLNKVNRSDFQIQIGDQSVYPTVHPSVIPSTHASILHGLWICSWLYCCFL